MNDTELKRAIAEAASVKDGDRRPALAEMIVKMVEPNHVTLDIFKSFLPVKNLKVGDNILTKVQRGRYPVRQMVPGSQHLADQVYTKDQVAFVFDRLIAGATANLWELESGDIGSAADMRAALKADLTDALVARIFNLLVTAWNSTDTPSNFTDASSGGITATVLDTMIEEIIERAGSVKAIFGSRRALYPIYQFATSVPVAVGSAGTAIPTDRFTEFYNNNILTTYKGIPIIQLSQTFKRSLPDVREKMIDTSRIVVVGEDAGKIAMLGGWETQDYTDYRTQPATYNIHGWQSWAMILDQVDRIGVIKGNT